MNVKHPLVWILNENKPGSAFSGAKMPETHFVPLKCKISWVCHQIVQPHRLSQFQHTDTQNTGLMAPILLDEMKV